MNKVVFPEANEALSEALQGQFATFIDNDKFYGHVKQASSNAITREMLEDCKPDKDHFLIHFVGVGDYEKYGFNKNADSFPKTANIKYHKTFETDGKLYREHQSSDPDKAIGIIKRAEYNPEMGRLFVKRGPALTPPFSSPPCNKKAPWRSLAKRIHRLYPCVFPATGCVT